MAEQLQQDFNRIAETEGEDEHVGLSDEVVDDVRNLLEHEQFDELGYRLEEHHPSDIADLIEKIDPDLRRVLVTHYAGTLDPDVFAYLEEDLCNELLPELDAPEIARILNELDSDDALDLIESLEEDFRKEILKNLQAKQRAAIEEGLTFPEDSAGRLMQREVVAVPQFWTVGKTIDYLRAAENTLPFDFFDIFVVDPMYHVVGEVPLSRILRAKRSTKIEELAQPDIHSITATMDQEEAAFVFRRDGLASAPVVDENGRLIGVITVDDIVDVIDEEAQEDFLKLGGVAETDIYRAVLDTTRSRFSWLSVNLLTAIAASVVIGMFEATIDQIVALAVLMPIVASMGGNAGTQALTVAVRALATKELSRANAWRVLWKEVIVGVLNGVLFAVLMGGIAAVWFTSPALGVVIGVAMVVNLCVAGFAGAGIPILLARYGMDPALASSVFLTTVTDVVGFFAFLGLAAMVLI